MVPIWTQWTKQNKNSEIKAAYLGLYTSKIWMNQCILSSPCRQLRRMWTSMSIWSVKTVSMCIVLTKHNVHCGQTLLHNQKGNRKCWRSERSAFSVGFCGSSHLNNWEGNCIYLLEESVILFVSFCGPACNVSNMDDQTDGRNETTLVVLFWWGNAMSPIGLMAGWYDQQDESNQ